MVRSLVLQRTPGEALRLPANGLLASLEVDSPCSEKPSDDSHQLLSGLQHPVPELSPPAELFPHLGFTETVR